VANRSREEELRETALLMTFLDNPNSTYPTPTLNIEAYLSKTSLHKTTQFHKPEHQKLNKHLLTQLSEEK
jgi:hypothetical protein